MRYYRVKKGCGGSTRWSFHPGGGTAISGQYVENELYTMTEIKKLRLFGYANILEPVEIPKNRIFWSFGVRFESV